jgi:hypothetical protein
MLIFGFLTIMNVRRTKKRVAVKPTPAPPQPNGTTQTQKQQRREQKTDAQLIVVSN